MFVDALEEVATFFLILFFFVFERIKLHEELVEITDHNIWSKFLKVSVYLVRLI